MSNSVKLSRHRVDSILDSLTDEAISVLWVWMETTPSEVIFDRMTAYLGERIITQEEALGIAIRPGTTPAS